MHICQFVPYGSEFQTFNSVNILKNLLLNVKEQVKNASGKVSAQTQKVFGLFNEKIIQFLKTWNSEKKNL